MVLDHSVDYQSEWAAIRSIAGKFGMTAETLRTWVRQAERDKRLRPGLTTAERERLAELEKGLLTLERAPQSPPPDLLNAVFRDAHSVKAGAGLLGLRHVEKAAHRLENVLDLLRSGRLSAEPEVCQALLYGVDLLRETLQSSASASPETDSRLAALKALTGT